VHTDKKNSTWLAIQFISLSIISVIILKLNIDHFGKELYGMWIILSSIWGFSSTLDFGFGMTIVKYVAEYRKNNEQRISTLLSSSILVFLILGIVILILGFVIAFLLYFENPNIIAANFKSDFILIFLILGISFYVRYVTIFFTSIFEGLNDFVKTSKIAIIQSLLLFLCVLIIIMLDLSLYYLSLSQLITSLISLITLFISFKIKFKHYRISIKEFELAEIKNIVKFSFSVQVISILNAVIDPLVKYIIGNFYSLQTVPAYEIARKFAVTTSGFFFTSFKIILPKTSALITNEQILDFLNNDLFKFSRYGVTYSALFYGVFLLPMVIFIKYIFNIDEAVIIFIILCLPESINNFGYGTYNFLLGIGNVRFLAILQLINLLVTTLALIFGFKLFNNALGFIGYFFSVLTGNILMLVLLTKKWNFNLRQFFKDTKIYRLVILILLLTILTLFYFYSETLFMISLVITSLMMITLVSGDIKYYLRMIYNEIKN
jgi:O-antigen/teichoic acid export membrane protein